ncbi:MAG TPA: hemolysin family protein [Miltoncostaeaceae bacterium]|nr:hemolysin family protein [Miltoncostaeaceae bacterium]
MILGLALLALIILWNAFFVAAEYAFVTANPLRMRDLAKEGNRRAERVVELQSNPTRFIAAVQVAITMSSLAAGAVGEPAVRRIVGSLFGPADEALPRGLTLALSVAVAFAVVTALTVVLGEIVPKTAVLQRPESVALVAITPVRLFTRIFSPFVSVLERLSSLTTRALGLQRPSEIGQRGADELRLMVESSTDEGILEKDEQRMLLGVLELPDTEVRQVMVPRPDVVALSVQMTPGEAAAVVRRHPYTRYPVHGGDLDDVRGTLHVRRLLEAMDAPRPPTDLAPLLRPAQLVLETAHLDDLLSRFRRGRDHLAVVVDEYGSVAGVVTLEDLIEEIVGEIADEFDTPITPVQQLGDREWLVRASLPVRDASEQIGVDLPTGGYESVGGLVFDALGRLPRPGDRVETPGLTFVVEEMRGRRITRVRVTVTPPEEEASAAPATRAAGAVSDGPPADGVGAGPG